jgi:ribosome-associated protein
LILLFVGLLKFTVKFTHKEPKTYMQNLSKAPSSVLSSAAHAAYADSSLQLALAAAQAADDRKGADMALLRVTEVSLLADYFVIVTGFSKAQVRAIANSVADKVETTLQRTPRHIEGQSDATWVLLDYGDVIIHVLLPQEREFYNLEAFWGHAERIDWASMVA